MQFTYSYRNASNSLLVAAFQLCQPNVEIRIIRIKGFSRLMFSKKSLYFKACCSKNY